MKTKLVAFLTGIILLCAGLLPVHAHTGFSSVSQRGMAQNGDFAAKLSGFKVAQRFLLQQQRAQQWRMQQNLQRQRTLQRQRMQQQQRQRRMQQQRMRQQQQMRARQQALKRQRMLRQKANLNNRQSRQKQILQQRRLENAQRLKRNQQLRQQKKIRLKKENSERLKKLARQKSGTGAAALLLSRRAMMPKVSAPRAKPLSSSLSKRLRALAKKNKIKPVVRRDGSGGGNGAGKGGGGNKPPIKKGGNGMGGKPPSLTNKFNQKAVVKGGSAAKSIKLSKAVRDRLSRLVKNKSASSKPANDNRKIVQYKTRDDARSALRGIVGKSANKFFKKATSKSSNFQIRHIKGGYKKLSFESRSNTPGYRKKYIKIIDRKGKAVKSYKDVFGPKGQLVNRKYD